MTLQCLGVCVSYALSLALNCPLRYVVIESGRRIAAIKTPSNVGRDDDGTALGTTRFSEVVKMPRSRQSDVVFNCANTFLWQPSNPCSRDSCTAFLVIVTSNHSYSGGIIAESALRSMGFTR